MGQLQSATPVETAQDEDVQQFELNELSVPIDPAAEDTRDPLVPTGNADDILILPLKKKKKQHRNSNVIPLTTIPVMRLPSPPPVSGQENEQQKMARRRKNSPLASACYEPAWYEDVFDKDTIENTRKNLGSLKLRGHSKEERAVILNKINNEEQVEVGGASTAKGSTVGVSWEGL
ncbi:hypothetical protein L211DRAFT_851751 [Terfezia boudieri ATCC MYA-4762]|uniref:Uncharacterized protein n=1 Tax=Terfezia boudieri ATCC MYA-4762 TaxID=1051890 RepID=A0A3N4LI79_9PEZI|nr:hypothetical protein L211DRAFT_851751 [Terfezia boudieri ATCC MYA-4762]